MKIILLNKKANYNYFIKDKYDAGLVLLGSEVKSIKNGKADISNAYVVFHEDSLWISNMNVASYKYEGCGNHDEFRLKKLLLKSNEINKLKGKVSQKGMTIVPIKVFLSDRNLIKVTIALAEGKKNSDRREDIKKRDWKRSQASILRDKG